LFHLASDARYRVCPQVSLLPCWLSFRQVGLEPFGSHPLGNNSLFQPDWRESRGFRFNLGTMMRLFGFFVLNINLLPIMVQHSSQSLKLLFAQHSLHSPQNMPHHIDYKSRLEHGLKLNDILFYRYGVALFLFSLALGNGCISLFFPLFIIFFPFAIVWNICCDYSQIFIFGCTNNMDRAIFVGKSKQKATMAPLICRIIFYDFSIFYYMPNFYWRNHTIWSRHLANGMWQI